MGKQNLPPPKSPVNKIVDSQHIGVVHLERVVDLEIDRGGQLS